MRQGFELGDSIEIRRRDGCGDGWAIWEEHKAKAGVLGFLGPCGRFYTPMMLGALVEEAHEDAADTPEPPLFGEDFVCMAEALIAEGLLRPGPVRGAKVWREV